MKSEIWSKTTYFAGIDFIVDSVIREYDISKANISVLRDANVISEEEYQYLMTAPRMIRQVTIGKLQGRDKTVTPILKAGIENARRFFVQSNGLVPQDILSIRNDAITVVGNKPITNLIVTPRVHFRCSGHYTSFCRLSDIFLYYYYDIVSNTENLDVKGMNDEAVQLHREYMLDFISELFYRAQTEGVKNALPILQAVHTQYIGRTLPVGFYREFNSLSKYRLRSDLSTYSTLYADYVTESDKYNLIEIAHNENTLRCLNKMLSSMYFGKR